MQLLYKQRNQLLLLLVCCLFFVLVIKPWQLYFLNDDFLHIPMPNKWLFLRGGFMRPVPNFVLLFDKWMYGTNAIGFFYTTIVFHIACVFSVFFFVRKLLCTYFAELSGSWLAFTTALLFLCYPYHAEPLMWVISRVSIMAALLTFLSLIFYINAVQKFRYLLLSWLCFVTALFTYESMWNILLLFAIITLVDVRRKRVVLKKALVLFGVMLVTFIVYIFIRVWALHSIAGDGYLEINENLVKVKLLIANLVKLAGRNFTPPFVNTTHALVFFAASIVVYTYCIYKVFKQNKQWGWLLLFLWTGMITGVITASPLGIDTHYNESERYLYYSSFFYCFFLAFLLAILVNRKYRFPAVAIATLVFVWLFADLQKNYRYASAVTRTTVETVAKNIQYKRAFFVDVPKKYKGSMIFRISLPEAIRWIVPEANYDSVVVVSQIETPSGKLPFKTGEATWSELAAAKHFNLVVPSVDSAAKHTVLNKDDVVFWYKEDGLYKVILP
jgi:hypothetical protein